MLNTRKTLKTYNSTQSTQNYFSGGSTLYSYTKILPITNTALIHAEYISLPWTEYAAHFSQPKKSWMCYIIEKLTAITYKLIFHWQLLITEPLSWGIFIIRQYMTLFTGINMLLLSWRLAVIFSSKMMGTKISIPKNFNEHMWLFFHRAAYFRHDIPLKDVFNKV